MPRVLSSELSTRLRGRYMGYHIHGLDYDEFIEFHNLQDSDESLSLFLQYGGLPQLRQLGLENTDLVNDYLENVINTIVLRDIIERENIRNVPLLRTLVRFIADNIGKQFSARSIVGFLKSQNTETSTNMVLNYLEYLCNGFRQEYFPCTCFRFWFFEDKCGGSFSNYGRKLENHIPLI